MKKPEISENEKTKRLAGNAFYKSKKTPKSQMIMLKLLQANRQNSLQKANKMAALAFFVKPDSEGLDIDYELVDVIYSVSNSLLNTQKTHFRDYNYSFYYFPVPWSFSLNVENYTKYILPWMEVYHYFRIREPNFDQIKIKKTLAWCPYCEKLLLETSSNLKKKEVIEQFKEYYSDKIDHEKKFLIPKEEITRRTVNTVEMKYVPPFWEGDYFKCPGCGKDIRLSFKFIEGSNSRYYPTISSPKFRCEELIIQIKTMMSPEYYLLKYQYASSYLSEKGYHQQINSFLQWCEPIVNQIEYEILKLVDENVLEKYLNQLFESKQDPTQGVEQN